MNNERSRNINEFKAYIEGFQAGKSGRPPNAVEWTEILAELRHVQVEHVDATMTLGDNDGYFPAVMDFSPPVVKLEDGDLGVLRAGPSTPRTFGNKR